MSYEIGRYDPCPCGSGRKFKFCCGAEGKKATKKEAPVGTIARYGPDDVLTTKVIAGVVHRGGDPILKKFHGDDPHQDPAVEAQIKAFFFEHGVQQVVQTDGNVGCPHEEGIDFPEGADCPFCPFWKGKQGSSAKVHRL